MKQEHTKYTDVIECITTRHSHIVNMTRVDAVPATQQLENFTEASRLSECVYACCNTEKVPQQFTGVPNWHLPKNDVQVFFGRSRTINPC